MPALASQVSVYLFTPVDSSVPRKVYPSWGQGGGRIHSGSQAPWICLCHRMSQRGSVNGARACVCPSLESSVTLRKGAQLGDYSGTGTIPTDINPMAKPEERGQERARLC